MPIRERKPLPSKRCNICGRDIPMGRPSALYCPDCRMQYPELVIKWREEPRQKVRA